MFHFTTGTSLLIMSLALLGQPAHAQSPATSTVDLNLIWSGTPLNADIKLHSSFDSPNGGVAEIAQGFPRPGGFGMSPITDGLKGAAIAVADRGGYVHYLAKQNINFQTSTVAFAFRHTGQRKILPRALFEVRGEYRIGIHILDDGVELYTAKPVGPHAQWEAIKLPCNGKQLLDGQWHRFVISWDQQANWGMIAIDDQQIQGQLKMNPAQRGPATLFLGCAALSKWDPAGSSQVGEAYDELTIWQDRADHLKPAGDVASDEAVMIAQCKQASLKALNTILSLQRYGGWQRIYTWPTLLGSPAQGRDYISDANSICNDKSESTPRTALQLISAYRILRDDTYLYPAIETGKAMVAAQSDDGYWVHGYIGTPKGLVINNIDLPTLQGEFPEVKLQDSVQAHPIELLFTLAQVTGDKTFLEAAKRGGEFVFRAQNPNGSWSHHWDPKRQCGSTVRGLPRGGEINDLAMNDAIDIMHLMYLVTGEKRFKESIDRAGQWILDADTGGKTVGWAQQYDEFNKPTVARAFEPAAWCRTATEDAAKLLADLHRTWPGDGRYLRKLEELQKWAHATADKDGGIFEYLEPATGRGVLMWDDKMYYTDQPADIAYLRDNTPYNARNLKPRPFVKGIDRIVAQAKQGMDEQEYISWLPTRIREELKTQDPECGMWVLPIFSNFSGSVGAAFTVKCNPLERMLQYIDLYHQRTEKPNKPLELYGRGPMEQALVAVKLLSTKHAAKH